MIVMKQKKEHTFNILILTMNTDMRYHNQFLMVKLYILKVFQCLHLIVIIYNKKSDSGYTLIADVDYHIIERIAVLKKIN